jgi:hypothetical protein
MSMHFGTLHSGSLHELPAEVAVVSSPAAATITVEGRSVPNSKLDEIGRRVIGSKILEDGVLLKGAEVFLESVTDTLSISQIASRNIVSHQAVSQSLIFSQLAIGSSLTARSEIIFVSVADVFAIYPRSAANVLSLSDVASVEIVDLEDTSSVLLFSQSAEAIVVHSASSVLIFSQLLSLNLLSHQYLTDTLVFSQEVQPFLQGHGVSNDIEFSQEACCHKTTQYITLQSTTSKILLPTPNFSDAQALLSSINSRKSMNGTRYTYVKRSNSHRLRYVFTLARGKSLELRNFIKQNNTSKLRLHNWKGEAWDVKIVNNPFEITVNSRNSLEAVIEFEGQRVC